MFIHTGRKFAMNFTIKTFLSGACPQIPPPPKLTRSGGTRLTPSAIAYTILGGGQGKWALWQFCPTTEESLKKMHWNFEVVI